MANRGKSFEDKIKECLSFEGVSVDRLPDPMGGLTGIRNICDYFVYKYPFAYYLECKTTHDNTWSLSNLTENQFNGLCEKSKIPGTLAGVLLWFVEKDYPAFIPIWEIEKLKTQGAKSVNIRYIHDIDHIVVPGTKKRVFFEYDGPLLLELLENYCAEQWEDI